MYTKIILLFGRIRDKIPKDAFMPLRKNRKTPLCASRIFFALFAKTIIFWNEDTWDSICYKLQVESLSISKWDGLFMYYHFLKRYNIF